jgi:hypothetical protein
MAIITATKLTATGTEFALLVAIIGVRKNRKTVLAENMT